MKRVLFGLMVFAVGAGDVAPARAAWDNVFQPTLFGCRRCESRRTPVVVQYQQPVVVAQAAPTPCNQCNTSFSQRCFYQPVTVMETRSYYEQVTTMQTSYFYQPVTTYRQSCYFDPTTCSYQQVTIPQCGYELRAKSCPVTSWVQRCAQVPVTTMQKTCYWQPQTTCCQTTTGALIPMGGSVPQTQQPPLINPGQPSVPPIIDQNRQPGAGNPTDAYRFPTTGGSNWQPAPGQQTTIPTRSNNPAPPAPVKLDRIVVGPDATVEGQVVRSDNAPRPNARLLFVSAQHGADRQAVTANTAGRFSVNLASGGWLVYVQNPDGTTSYHSRIEIADAQPARLTINQ